MRHVLVPAVFLVLITSACASGPPPVPTQPVIDPRQRDAVQSLPPAAAEALMQSMIALSETNPAYAAQAREQAIEYARQAGVVIDPRRICGASCALPRNEGERQAHMDCLIQRLNCLRPR
ncbi:MAG TPA: hypothetical protein VFA20_20505 [Myxococcaceae bacterium]|nr:hypothetical protein [Myxococcaceae bacterium]